jgi:LCP family protein required for cell wall assembly
MSFTVRRVGPERSPRRAFPWRKVLGWAMMLQKPFHLLVHHYKKHREKKRKQAQRVHILKRVLLVLTAVLCAFLLFAGTVKALVALRILNIRSIISVAGVDLPRDSFGHTNILLLGVGDANHDGVDLTDTMIVASIDAKTKSIVLLSLPRDLYLLDAHNMGKGRINSLYLDYKQLLRSKMGRSEQEASQLALQELAKEIGTLLHTTIHEVVKVDFSGFTEAVDAIGGFDIDVPHELIDPQYPATEDSYTTLVIHAGPQHFDGETALKYARSRHSTSDFDRSARQQEIIAAIGDKVKTEGIFTHPDRVLSLLSIIEKHLETTMQVRELIGLAQLGLQIDRSNMLTLQVNDQAGLYNTLPAAGGFLYSPPREQFGGASVLLPVSIPPMPITWKQLQTLVSLLVDTRAPYLARPTVNVLNAGAAPGSSKRLGAELIRYDFHVGDLGNADNRNQAASSVVANETDRATGDFFAQLLHIPLHVVAPGQSKLETGTISIELGKNYTYAPLQSLVATQQ